MAIIPEPRTGDCGAHSLETTLDGVYQYAVWYTMDGGVTVGRIERGVQRWGVDHDEHALTGAEYTALGLPVSDDDHNYLSLGIGYDEDLNVRRIYLWGNMHGGAVVPADDGTFRMIQTTTTDGTIATWEQVQWLTDMESGMTNVDNDEWTYPTPAQHPNGDLTLLIRNRISGDGDWYTWRLPAGSDTWGAPVKIFKGYLSGPANNESWSAYPTRWHYDPVRSRWWISWIHRDNQAIPVDVSNFYPAAMYSDDDMVSWKAADGTALTLPLEYDSHLDYDKLGLNWRLMDGETHLKNYGGICTDQFGNPWVIGSVTPLYIGRWFGTVGGQGAWTQRRLTNFLAGVTVTGRVIPAWIHNKLWLVSIGTSDGGHAPRMWSVDGLDTVKLAPTMSADIGWESFYDDIAYRLYGTVETLWVDGDTPHVGSFGGHASRIAA